MQLTFLVDNNTITDKYFLAEPGLSILIEDDDSRVLFDAGYSDAFLVNARRKGADLRNLDWVALSHGHLDHSWGLDALIRHYVESVSENMACSRPQLLAHPGVFATKQGGSLSEIGMLLSRDKLERHFDVCLSSEPVSLSDNLLSLGEIERRFEFEASSPIGERIEGDALVPDTLPDDTALAYKTDAGLVVISGCAHSGICNTVEQARKVTGQHAVRAVLGGFHLLNAPQERLQATAEYLGELNLEALYCCHCTDLAAKIALSHTCPVKEVGSGLTLTF